MNKAYIKSAVLTGATLPYDRGVEVLLGDVKNGYVSGDLVDANFVGKIINDVAASSSQSQAFKLGIGDGSIIKANSDASATGKNSVVLSYNNTSTDQYGRQSEASGTLSITAGTGTVASGALSVALGNDTTASGLGAVSIGLNTQANGDYSIAQGTVTKADGKYAVALGGYNEAGALYATYIGYGSCSVRITGLANATTYTVTSTDSAYNPIYNTIIPGKTKIYVSGAPVVGMDFATVQSVSQLQVGCTITTDRTLSANALNNASGFIICGAWASVSLAINCASTTGSYSFAGGPYSTAKGNSSFAYGRGCHAIGSYSVSLGEFNTASGTSSTAIGLGNTAAGKYSIAAGNGSVTYGEASMAICGYIARHIWMYKTDTPKQYKANKQGEIYAMVKNTINYVPNKDLYMSLFNGMLLFDSNKDSTRFGKIESAKWDEATQDIIYTTEKELPVTGRLMAIATMANGKGSIAGSNAISIGNDSIAHGYDNRAVAYNSYALGMGTTATSEQELVVGLYNKPTTDSLLTVGNGTNHFAKDGLSNALEVHKDGHIMIKDWTEGDTRNNEQIPMYNLQEKIKNISEPKGCTIVFRSANTDIESVKCHMYNGTYIYEKDYQGADMVKTPGTIGYVEYKYDLTFPTEGLAAGSSPTYLVFIPNMDESLKTEPIARNKQDIYIL